MPLLKVLLRWAEAERGRNQFKAAKRLYEELVTHTALRDLAVVWLSYAGFCAGRGKVKAARKVYVRGCQTATLPQAQSDLLYNAFLNFENAILQASGPSATAGPVVATRCYGGFRRQDHHCIRGRCSWRNDPGHGRRKG